VTTVAQHTFAVASGAYLAMVVLAMTPVANAGPGELPLAPCYNGLTPLNPYADNCGLLPRPARVPGSAPDQTAILNCSVGSQALRQLCLALYVNGGGASFPGSVAVPGYHP